MIAKAKRRRNDVLSTATFAHATARISIPSCIQPRRGPFEGARDFDDFRSSMISKCGPFMAQ
jgi:hypothetical protein